MAGDWIKWTVGLAGKREVRVIASRLHRDRHEIAGRLMVLWEWLDENLSEDDIDPATGDACLQIDEDWCSHIDEIAGLLGMAEALASPVVCWITARSGGRITFPNLGRHNGRTAKTRATEARKKSRQRREICPGTTGTKTGPEKRREEYINTSPTPHAREAQEPGELLTEAQAAQQAHNAGVPDDYARYVFPDWQARGGRDGAGVLTAWAAYVKKRWGRERPEWESGTHRGKQKSGGNPHGSDRNTDGQRAGSNLHSTAGATIRRL